MVAGAPLLAGTCSNSELACRKHSLYVETVISSFIQSYEGTRHIDMPALVASSSAFITPAQSMTPVNRSCMPTQQQEVRLHFTPVTL